MKEVVVIGAGIVGASAAYQLAVGGAGVTVVDDHRPGGATAAGAGIIAAVSSKPSDLGTARFRIDAARHYLELDLLCSARGLEASYGRAGQLTLALTDDDVAQLRAEYERSIELVDRFGTRAVGQPELLTSQQIRDRHPAIGANHGGLMRPEIARVDGAAMRDALRQLAATAGAKRVVGTAELVTEGGAVIGVRTQDGLIEADAVLVAAGAWSGALTARAPVLPHRGQLLHLRMPGLSDLPILDTCAGHYLLTFPGDVVVIGATREAGADFNTVTDGQPTAGGMAQVLAEGMSLVPSLRDAQWIGPRVGFRPASRDGRPFLGRAPDVDGLYLATGMGPSGLTLGPYCGSVIARHILGDPSAPEIPASFDPAR